MRRDVFGWLASALILGGFVCDARGAVQDRIVSGAGKSRVALPQSVSPKAGKATDLGEADGGTALTAITLHFNMTAAQTAALTQLLADQQNPASAKYHQWLTPEQFADQFGLSAADLATVSQWATGQGFKIVSVARSRTFLQFSGTVDQAQAAFQTSIHKMSLNGEEHIANVSNISLPSGIAGVVAGVSGLSDFRVKPRMKVRQVQPRASSSSGANPAFSSSVSGNTYIAPGDFYTIYDASPLLSSSIDGTGVSIAVAGQTDILLSDIAAFRAASGLSANVPTVKLYGADPGTPLTNGVAEDESEADLDVEWSGAVAPSATIIYANSKDVFNSMMQIVDNKLAPIASISYGDCESAIGQPDLNTLNAVLMQANAEGITVVGPAGDSGATDCDYQTTIATQGLAVDFPASSPYVTGVGGTEFNEGTGTYFSTTNNANGGSALSYIPEAVWNATSTGGELSAGGGGVSTYFSKPAWQTGAGVPADSSRDVPDVALNADPDHDGYLFCTQGSCVVGFRASTNGTLSVVGGTSASTPAFAGILALVEQKIGTSFIGNANPVIYALANSTYYNNVFHDVTVGNNESPCQTGSTDCPTGGEIGYSAGVGYDLATGWGSVDAFNLANDWTLVTPSVTGVGSTASTTTVTASAASVTSGTSVTITAMVASGATTSTVVPTGTVQFLVDNVASGGAVALSSGVATFTLATGSLSSGSHTVSAAYSGDTIFAGSKGAVSVDVTSAVAPDFTLTPATTTVTAAAGGTAPGILYTVTPVNGFTGPVNFTVSTTSPTLNATPSLTASSLQITAPTAGTTTLNLSAYVSSDAKTGTGLARHAIGLVRVRNPQQPGSKGGVEWYAGPGAALACVVLLMVPRRKRMGALLGLVVSLAALGGMLGLQGCGSNSTVGSTQINATPGTYTIIVTATGTSAGITVSHNATVTFVVQ
jgi:subtilase family serine protease